MLVYHQPCFADPKKTELPWLERGIPGEPIFYAFCFVALSTRMIQPPQPQKYSTRSVAEVCTAAAAADATGHALLYAPLHPGGGGCRCSDAHAENCAAQAQAVIELVNDASLCTTTLVHTFENGYFNGCIHLKCSTAVSLVYRYRACPTIQRASRRSIMDF